MGSEYPDVSGGGVPYPTPYHFAHPRPGYDGKGRPILTPGEQEEAIKLYDSETSDILQDRPKDTFHDVVDGQVNATQPNKDEMLRSYARQILDLVAPGWYDREDMEDTPRRFAAQLQELTTPEENWKFTVFPATSDDMVSLGPIPFYTLCAHHVIPFYGQAYIAYIPENSVAGLSKLPRLVHQLSKGLWMQEDLTTAIADGLESRLRPAGVAVLLEGEHMCMSMRGVKTAGVITTTSAMRGVFADHTRTAKAEFLEIVRSRR